MEILVYIVVALGLIGAIITIISGAGSKEAKRIVTESNAGRDAAYAAARKKGEEAAKDFRERHRR